MEREYEELQHGLGKMTHIAQSDSERQQLMRAYLSPSTHEIEVRYDGVNRFTIQPKLKAQYVQPEPPATVTLTDDSGDTQVIEPPTPAAPTDVLGLVGTNPIAAAELAELEKLSQAELLTRAAELEVDGVNKSMSKAKIAARIIEKRYGTPAKE